MCRQKQRYNWFLLTITLLVLLSCHLTNTKYKVEFSIVDGQSKELEDVFVSVYRMVGSLNGKSKVKEPAEGGCLRFPTPQTRLRIVEQSDIELRQSYIQMVSQYDVKRLKNCFDSYFLSSPHLDYYFEWRIQDQVDGKDATSKSYLYSGSFQLTACCSLNMELLEFSRKQNIFEAVTYAVPLKHYVVFRKIGYSMQSVVIDPSLNKQTIQVQLQKVSANPHLNRVDAIIRELHKEDWNTSEGSSSDMSKLLMQLEQEKVYAQQNGYTADYVALKQYLASTDFDILYITGKEGVSAHRNRRMDKILRLAEQEIANAQPDTSTMNRLVWDMTGDMDSLVRICNSGRHGENMNNGPIIEERLLNRALNVYRIYLEYLNSREYVFPIFPIKNELTDFYLSVSEINDVWDPNCSVRNQLRRLALRSLQVNPFQREAWRAFDLTYDESPYFRGQNTK